MIAAALHTPTDPGDVSDLFNEARDHGPGNAMPVGIDPVRGVRNGFGRLPGG
jgi:hypothetical protein